MKIKEVKIEPHQPEPGQTLEVTVKLHNDSAGEAIAMVNATLGREGSSSPNTMQQARELQADECTELTLLKLRVSERFQPGQYQVRVWLARQDDDPIEKTLIIDEAKGFKRTF